MKFDKLVSVIIPVYKVEKYLDRCVGSVVNQTYKNLEIILVDDGSPDKCPKICDDWAKKDNRIKVIHKENGGLSSARNAGLDIATGDYISFLDSDDSLHIDTIKFSLFECVNTGADIVSFKTNIVNEKDVVSCDGDMGNYKTKEYNNDQILTSFFSGTDGLFMISCAKLYKREIFNNLRFEYGKLHEDEFIIVELLNKAHKLVVIDKPFYNYLKRDGSITSARNLKSFENSYEAFLKRYEYIKNNLNGFMSYENVAFLSQLRILYITSKNQYKDFAIKILQKYNEMYRIIKPKDYKNFLFKHFKWLYILLWKIKNRK